MMIWKWFLRTLLSLIIIIMLFICFLLTPYGFQFTFYLASKIVPGELQYQNISGMLTGPIQIKQLDYQNRGTHLHISHLNLDWSPTSLLHKKLEISHFSANGITLITPKSQKSREDEKSFNQFIKDLKPYEPKPLKLPLSLEVDHAHLTNLEFGSSSHDITTQIKLIDINGVLYPNNIHISAKIYLLKPTPLIATLTATGTLAQYTLNATLDHNFYQLAVHGEGNRNGITLIIPKSHVLDGSIVGKMQLTWYPQLNWSSHLNLAQVNLQLLNAQLPKSIMLSIMTKGKLILGNPLFDLTAALKTDQTHINIAAHHHALWNISWAITIPRIQDIYANGSGSLITHGSLQGATLTLPHTQGTLSGKKIYLDGLDMKQISAQWHLYFDTQNLSTLALSINKLEYNQRKLDAVNLNVSGHLLKHDLHATLDIGKHSLVVTTKAHYNGSTWIGVISQFTSQHNQFGNWKLHAPVQFEYSPNKIYLDRFCVYTRTNASLCLHGSWEQDKPWNVWLNSDRFDFVRLEKQAMINTQFTSKLSINAHATGMGSDITNANLTMHISPGELTYLMGSQVITTKIRQSAIDLMITQKAGLSANLNLNFSMTDSIKANLTIPNFTDHSVAFKDKELRSKLSLSMHDFRFVTLFEHVLKLSFGRLKGHFTLTGTVGDPKIKGDAQLTIPHFEYTTAKIQAHDIEAHIHANTDKLTYTLKGYALNKAPIYMTGKTTFDTPHITTDFTITTKNAEIINTNQMTVFADTTIKFLITHDALNLDGDVLITKAKISPVDFSSTSTMPKANMVYIGLPKSKQPQATQKINLNLNVTLGNDVTLAAYGINAQLAGAITLTMTPQHTTIANGQVRITHGTFQAYGQYLRLEPGSSVSFTQSPVGNPTIDARAYKLVNTTTEGVGRQLAENSITVGVHIHGSLRQLKFSLYSQPPGLAQADILSYLILGYASGNTNAASMSVLLDAANAMIDSGGGLNQPVGLTDRLKKALGIKEIGMRNETVVDAIGNPIEDQSAFVVGDQLTKDIYIEYSRGMVVPDNIFTVQYRLNDHWLFQTSTGSGGSVGTGADILYQIESN